MVIPTSPPMRSRRRCRAVSSRTMIPANNRMSMIFQLTRACSYIVLHQIRCDRPCTGPISSSSCTRVNQYRCPHVVPKRNCSYRNALWSHPVKNKGFTPSTRPLSCSNSSIAVGQNLVISWMILCAQSIMPLWDLKFLVSWNHAGSCLALRSAGIDCWKTRKFLHFCPHLPAQTSCRYANALSSSNLKELPAEIVCAVSPAQKRPSGFRHNARKTIWRLAWSSRGQ